MIFDLQPEASTGSVIIVLYLMNEQKNLITKSNFNVAVCVEQLLFLLFIFILEAITFMLL